MDNSERQASIGLLIFIATEIMFFAGLLSAYWVLRAQVIPWPPLDQPRLPVTVTGINTAILLASAVAIYQARFRKTLSTESVLRWLLVAATSGLTFLVIQGYEWLELVRFGLTAAANIYGGFFYIVVGAHAAHVIIGLAVLMLVLWRTFRGAYTQNNHTGLGLCRMYWIFVVLLWPVIYVALYLL